MKRFQLTIVFVVFSALTIGAGAMVVNSLMSSSAERSLLSLTEAQSERDARFIANLVSQLLAEDAPSEPLSPPILGSPTEPGQFSTFRSTTLQVDAPTVLDALDIQGLAIFDTAGEQLWASMPGGELGGMLTDSGLDKILRGEIVSGIVYDPQAEKSEASGDVVVSFVPLVGEISGETVQVLGVSRTVPPGVTGLLDESSSTVLWTTLISLSSVFVVLLAFVLAADNRIWRRNQAALALEHEQQERLGRKNRELNALNESKNRFISAISHELSNPLTSLVAFLDLVLRNRTGNLNERQVDQLNTARRNGAQLNRLVADLSHAASEDVATLQIVHRQFDIRPALDEATESLSHDLDMRQQKLKMQVDEDLGSMEGDRGRIVQVISNLVSNASKYSLDGSTIQLNASADDSQLHVEVVDEGIGISEEDQEHMFEMFWRADNPNVDGAGIGLVLAKQIIEGHGGQIGVSSVLGKGTTMRFDVPLKPAVGSSSHGSGDEGNRPQLWETAA